MKKIGCVAGALVGLMMIAGCAGQTATYTTNTIIVDKNGKVEEISIEDYSGGNYDMNKLSAYVNDEINTFNAKASEEVIVLKTLDTTDTSKVYADITYSDISQYNAFNMTDYYVGDYDASKITGELISTGDGCNVEPGSLSGQGYKMIVINGATDVVCKGKVAYRGSGINVNGDTYTVVGDQDAVIVYK